MTTYNVVAKFETEYQTIQYGPGDASPSVGEYVWHEDLGDGYVVEVIGETELPIEFAPTPEELGYAST